MKNYIEYVLFLFLGFIVRTLGLRTSRRLSIIIAFVFYYIIPIRKQVTLNNLRKAFPDYCEGKIKKIAFGSYRNFAITLVEILFIPSMTQEQMEKSVCSENDEIMLVRKVYERNNGLIVLSGHFGNWEYTALSGSLQNKLPFHVVVKPQRNHLVDNYLNRLRTKWINKIVPLGTSIRKVYTVLKEKNIVAIVADQRGPADGVRVKFFDQPTAIYPGPALLAIKTKAPIVYGLAVRQRNYSYKLYITEINLDNLPDEEENKIKEISQRHMAFLESFIRKYPEQWLWMHNIWKY